MIIHLRDHEARHFAKNKELLVVRPVNPQPRCPSNGTIFWCKNPSFGRMPLIWIKDLANYCPFGKPGSVVDCKEAWGLETPL